MEPRPASPNPGPDRPAQLRPVPQRPLLELLPTPARRVAGVMLLGLTLWLASIVALFS